jgi:hypothetical protein
MSDKRLALEHIIKNIAEGNFTPTSEKPMTLAEAIRRTRLKEKQVDDREFNSVNKDQALGYEETQINEYGDRLNATPVSFEDGGKKKLKEMGYDGAGGINPAQGGEFKGNQPGFPRVVPKIAPPVGNQQAGRGALRVGTSTSKQLNKQGIKTSNVDTQEDVQPLVQPIPIDKEDIKKINKKVVKEAVSDYLPSADTVKDLTPFLGTYRSYQRAKDAYSKGDTTGALIHGGATALGAVGDVATAGLGGTAIKAGLKGLTGLAARKAATAAATKAVPTAVTKAAPAAGKVVTGTIAKDVAPTIAKDVAPTVAKDAESQVAKTAATDVEKQAAKPGVLNKLAPAAGGALGALAAALSAGTPATGSSQNALQTVSGPGAAIRGKKLGEETGQDRRKVDNMPRTMKGDGQARREVQYVDRENEPTSSKSKLARLASYKVNVIDEESSMQSAKDANDSKNNSLDQGPDKNKTNIDQKTKVYNYDGDTEIIINPDLNKNTLDMKEAKKAMMVARFKKIISDK